MKSVHRPSWISRGWMSFTLANNAVLHLGGTAVDNGTSVRMTPDTQISAGVSDATSFLALGIPQALDKTRFADKTIRTDANGHTIKHAVIDIESVGAGSAAPYTRFLDDGSAPTSALGEVFDFGDGPLEYHNSVQAIFNFKLINISGDDIVVTVRPYE